MNFFNGKSKTQRITLAGVIAALYALLTLVAYPLSYGAAQFRISEALTVLPLFFVEAIPGLTAGCLIANIFGGNIIDILAGTAATLLAAILTALCRKIRDKRLRGVLGILPPVIVNALVVPITYLAISEIRQLYLLSALSVGVGQVTVLILLGMPLYVWLHKHIEPHSM